MCLRLKTTLLKKTQNHISHTSSHIQSMHMTPRLIRRPGHTFVCGASHEIIRLLSIPKFDMLSIPGYGLPVTHIRFYLVGLQSMTELALARR